MIFQLLFRFLSYPDFLRLTIYDWWRRVFVTDDSNEGLSAVSAPWEDSRLDERIYADTPNYLTFQLNSKRYAVPYHPVARLRASQTAGVGLPFGMITNKNYINNDGNRCNDI